MSMTKLLALLLSLVMVLSLFAGCQGGNTTTTTGSNSGSNTDTTGSTEGQKEVVYQPIDPADAVEHESITSVYEMIGSKVTIDMVTEDKVTGLATITYEGKKYEAGMDFLSMAMVYNCKPAGEYKTEEEVYNQWWKLYIQRWNYLAAEIPLYSNIYYDLYNAKIQNFVTSPYWSPASAIIASTVKTGETNSVILGSSTDLSGAFRNSSWGKTSPGSADLDIEELTSGHSTVMTGKDGAMMWNMKALAEVPVAKVNEDGTLTYTIKVKNDLKFSDGSSINAKNYIVSILANSNEVGKAAGGSGKSGQTLVGYDEFYAFTGANAGASVGEGDKAVTASKYFKGVQLLDDYTFAVTFTSDYAGYYYAQSYASFGPSPMALYVGSHDIIVDAETKCCGLSEDFYKKVEKNGTQVYEVADVIKANMEWDSALPYSGPYYVSNYNESTLTATLKLNPYYPGDDARGTASIETITYVKVIPETQMTQFKAGQVDVIAGITGGDETKEALKVVSESNGKFAETHYDRAGYGKIGLRGDFGPTGFVEVRQAIMHSVNRSSFAQTFTGGYGSVVHGPYYTGSAAYQAVKNEILIDEYEYNIDTAIECLEEGGWVFNVRGETFDPAKDDVRYKKLEGYEKSLDNLNFATVDGKYKTVKIDGEYYMPLAINWYGTTDNPVTDLLVTEWYQNENSTKKLGLYMTKTDADFNSALYGELFRNESYGYNGTPKLNAVNFATGFTSAIYDYSWNWTLDKELWTVGYSVCYIADEADYWENYK